MAPAFCSSGNDFLEINGSIPPSMSNILSWGFSECEIMCQRNCSCTAFAAQQDGLVGCQLYYGKTDLLWNNMGRGDGTVYVRVNDHKSRDGRRKKVIVLSIVCSAVLVFVISLCFLLWRKHKLTGNKIRIHDDRRVLQLGPNIVADATSAIKLKLGKRKAEELPLFCFCSIETATNYFSPSNKLGEGGFGPVYKGKLPGGQEIAVKRLAKNSGQGVEEFINEVTLISKLQHRNLVRLLGCCIQGEEKILVYEYMPNRSLDSFIFDSTGEGLLDWRKRVNIIEQIAQGLLYLHKYSRLRIIHRDLKTSNILLDGEMNPKISDFGMARIFGDHETRAKTRRIVGTYGYMSPEYAMNGLYSEKSDVFSFGVIVLEMMSGKKNTAYESDNSSNLLAHAWHLWKEGKSRELMDPTLADSFPGSVVCWFVQLGLLCVQERAVDRPTMSDVVSMLHNDSLAIPPPKQPAFLVQTSANNFDAPSGRQNQFSINDLTVSELYAR
ncbi:hypothetical protein Ancab_039716 [Ancistrocladus abbreviatus]